MAERATTRRVRRGVAVAAILGAGLLAVLLVRSGGDDRRLRVTFREAVQVVAGQEVRVAGRKVGEVRGVEEVDGDAVVELAIDHDAWPLHRGTTARLRFGTLSGYAGRFLDLVPGPASQPALASGAVLGTSATVTPVEFDELWNTFDGPARYDLRGTLDGAGATVRGRGPQLARSLRLAGPGLEGMADLMADVGADPAALHTLVRQGARVAGALQRREPALRELLHRAAGTVDELARRAREQQMALERLPSTLTTARATLRRLDASIAGLRGLVTDLAPGARALRAVAPDVRRITSTLYDVAPAAATALEAGRRNAPAIERFLRTATPVLPRVGAILEATGPIAGCLRPYAPEIAATLTTWTGFATSDPDGLSARANLTQLPPLVGAGTPADAQEITRLYRNRIFYAMPRPPGLDNGKPWFLPECGAGPESLDPANDPERE